MLGIRMLIRNMLNEEVIAPKCPIRSYLYGGIPGVGGYGSYTELEVGVGEMAEAAHCILGSLGKQPTWDDMLEIEYGHIQEEMGIIERIIDEYSRYVYLEQIKNPTKDIKPEYRERVAKNVEKSIESMLTNSSKLEKMANNYAYDVIGQKDMPLPIKSVAAHAYYLLVELARQIKYSFSDYPKFVFNPFSSKKLKMAVLLLREKIDEMFGGK